MTSTHHDFTHTTLQSALINRLLGRKRAKTANTPGVTRSLQWIRVATDKNSISASGSSGIQSNKSGFELLDSPGIIPSDMMDQGDALLLAACNSVGVGAYDNQAVAAYLCDRLQALALSDKHKSIAVPRWRQECCTRYGFDPLLPLSQQNIAARWGSEHTDGSAPNWMEFAAKNQDRIPTGEDMVFIVADNKCMGDPENAARKILQDFRSGRMGPITLQCAPEGEGDDGHAVVDSLQQEGLYSMDNVVLNGKDGGRESEEVRRRQQEEIEERAAAARESAKSKGLELPPVVEEALLVGEDNEREYSDESAASVSKPEEKEVGKGMFDGW